jgi:hypothetical protein
VIYVSANQIKVNPIAGKVYFRCNQMLSGPKMQQQLYPRPRLTRGRKLGRSGGRRLSNFNFLIRAHPSISVPETPKLVRGYIWAKTSDFWVGIPPNRRTSALLINLHFSTREGPLLMRALRFPPCILCPSQRRAPRNYARGELFK